MQALRAFALALTAAAAGLPAALVIADRVETAQAAATAPFTPAAFDAARKAGGPILVEVTAPWCSVCRAQKPILSKLFAQPKFAKLTVFQVDFDSQKDALKLLGVSSQSTLISYRGVQEVGRSSGVTNAQAIEDQLNKSI